MAEKVPKVIMIGGAPGTGKTTVAINVAKILKIDQILQTDLLRDVMWLYESEKDNPMLFTVTHECWKFLGKKSRKNVIRGALLHAETLHEKIIRIVRKSLKDGRSIIVEGAHVTPALIKKINPASGRMYGFILLVKNMKKHLKFFDLKNEERAISYNKWYENFREIRTIQSYLAKTAGENGFYVIENDDIGKTVGKIIEVISEGEDGRV
jgi:2-phosphoglycerate kinase